jgi:hypothetical protein
MCEIGNLSKEDSFLKKKTKKQRRAMCECKPNAQQLPQLQRNKTIKPSNNQSINQNQSMFVKRENKRKIKSF